MPVTAFVLLRIGGLTPLVNLALGRILKPLTPVELRFGSVRSDALHFLEADDVVVLAPLKGAKVPLLTINSLRLEFDAYGAWSGRVPKDEALKLARIRGLSVFVLRDTAGQWNTSVLFQPRQDRGAKKGSRAALPLLPAGRVELEDSQVVFNDESKGFHSSIERLQGSLDTRALPLLAFSLAGRTEGVARDNLSMAGEADLREKSLDGRFDLASVELKDYLNYLLPGKGLRFEDGKASLSVRLRTRPGQELLAEGRADLERGQLRIPGVAEPLSALTGRIAFDPQALHFHAVSARFLSSEWSIEGGIHDLRHPSFDLRLKNPAFGLEALSEQVHGLQPLALSGSAQVDVSMVGAAKSPHIQGSVSAPWLSLGGVELQSATARVEMAGPHLSVDGLRATVWEGALQGGLSLGLGKEGHIQADMVLDGVRLEMASIHGQRPLPLSGTAFVELQLRGPVRDPTMKAHLEVPSAALGLLPLGKVDADADWAPEAWRTKFGLMDGRIKGDIAVNGGKHGSFHNSAVAFQGIDLGGLARGLATAPPSTLLKAGASKGAAWLAARLKGQADAKLTLEGPLHQATVWIEFQRLKGQLAMEDGFFALKDAKRPLDLEGEGSLGFGGGDALFGRKEQPLRLSLAFGGHQWEVQALGRYPLKPDGIPGALELSLDGDLRLLDAFAFFNRSGGRLSFDGRVGGTLDAPQAKGELKVDSFSTEPAAYLAPIKDGKLRAQLREETIEVPELSFRSGGEVRASGRLDLSAGLKALAAELSVSTDLEGLRLQNWDAMGSGNVIFDSLKLSITGDNQPITLSGRIELANAVIHYAGQAKKDAGGEEAARKRGLNLDLRVGLGANVWYEKLHDKQVDLFDPSQWLKGVADSAMETLQRPDMYFRLRPTAKDFVIQGVTPDIQMLGELSIDRGRITVMENEFEIKSDRTDPRVRFAGRQAEIWASAVGRLRYNRDNPLTGRPQARAVNVILDISPLDEEELEKSGLAHAFLNYKLAFSSDPEIIPGNAAQQREAILNLVVLGDPMVDLDASAQAANGAAIESKQSAQALGETQINRVFSGEIRKQLASWSRKGFKFLGTGLIDVFRVVPRFKYQASSASQGQATQSATTAADASKQARDNQLIYSDTTLEVGKSVTEKLYASLQAIHFGDQSLAAQNQSAGQVQRVTRPYGTRTGFEYQLSPNRTLEGYWNYSVDDNLEPVAFDPDHIDQAHSGVIRLRNTIPTGTYTSALARERQWGSTVTAQP